MGPLDFACHSDKDKAVEFLTGKVMGKAILIYGNMEDCMAPCYLGKF